MTKKIIQDVIIRKKEIKPVRQVEQAPVRVTKTSHDSVKTRHDLAEKTRQETVRKDKAEDFFARQAAARDEKQKEKEESRGRRREKIKKGVDFMKRAICFGFKKRADDFRFEANMCVDENKGRGWMRKIGIVVAIVAVAFIAKISLSYLSYATVKVSLHNEIISIDSRLKAYKDSSKGALTFETSRLEKEESQAVLATGLSKNGQKASGKVVIYNIYTTKSQKLVAGTRLESNGGKIFRTKSTVYVPGMGSIEVAVSADKSGSEYNIGLSDFSLPAYKGDPRYTKIYGRSKSAMSGGAAANSRIVAKADMENARKAVQKTLEEKLRVEISAQIPEKYISYDKAVKIDFIEDASNPKVGDAAAGTNGSVINFKMKGIATGFLFNKDELSKALADIYTDKDSGAGVVNLNELGFAFLSSNLTGPDLIFVLKGKGKFVWDVNEGELVNKLMSTGGKTYGEIFKQYPYIDRAEIIFKPSWWKWMPKNIEHVKVEKVVE